VPAIDSSRLKYFEPFSQPQWRFCAALIEVPFPSSSLLWDVALTRSTDTSARRQLTHALHILNPSSPSQPFCCHPILSFCILMIEISSAKMPFFHLAFSLLSVIGSVTAAKVSISEVSSAVQLATSSFAPAVTYAGPTGSASSVLVKSSTTKVSPKVAAATAGAAPYWLESITHQGISAFNSNPASYQVFRNVKSFGAKGKNSAVSL
jgi:hypothetical protein